MTDHAYRESVHAEEIASQEAYDMAANFNGLACEHNQLIQDAYVIVRWPDSQCIMEQDWSDECFLINSEAGIEAHGEAAYLAPLRRLLALRARIAGSLPF